MGNTLACAKALLETAVHPHTRGEHVKYEPRNWEKGGSSPHPWGTRIGGTFGCQGVRFIPTPVGNTMPHLRLSFTGAVHPHTRGEHLTLTTAEHRRNGSSPHPWGTLLGFTQPKMHMRFIPTPVGNTAAIACPAAGVSVHPHTRGEHGGDSLSGRRSLGSSPHPWGTPSYLPFVPQYGRFIPTPVGNTRPLCHQPDTGAVHPHTRGEHCQTYDIYMRLSGSSPHPWGTLFVAS